MSRYRVAARGKGLPGIRAEARASWRDRGRALAFALPALFLPLGVLMLLRGGAVTATEAGAVACLFAVTIGVVFYRRSTLGSTWQAAKESANDTAVILFLLAASGPLACGGPSPSRCPRPWRAAWKE